jgi:hypothetical protein
LEEISQEGEGEKGHSKAADQSSLVQRMYAQTGTREWDPLQVGRIYHPAVGYINQCQ